jgi:ribosome-binding protein aMBF1 (putative translation factor)
MERKSVNCHACGTECFEEELVPIKLAGFSKLDVCESCLAKTPESSFKEASDAVKQIMKVASSREDVIHRLSLIKKIVDGNL